MSFKSPSLSSRVYVCKVGSLMQIVGKTLKGKKTEASSFDDERESDFSSY